MYLTCTKRDLFIVLSGQAFVEEMPLVFFTFSIFLACFFSFVFFLILHFTLASCDGHSQLMTNQILNYGCKLIFRRFFDWPAKKTEEE